MPFTLWLELSRFYVSEFPDGGEPLIVIRDKSVLDVNVPAAKKGVVSGMDVRQAKALLPVKAIRKWERETHAAKQIAWLDVCTEFSGTIEPIDQHVATIDLSGHPDPFDVVGKLVGSLELKTRLPVRCGAADSRWIAKLAADHDDQGAAWLDPESFLAEIPVTELLPALPESRQRLYFLGYYTIGAVAQVPLEVLRRQFGQEALVIHAAARGRHSEPVKALYPLDSIRECLIFEGPVDTLETIDLALRAIASRLGKRLSEQGKFGTKLRLEIETEGEGRESRLRKFTKPVADGTSALAALRLLMTDPPTVSILALRTTLHDLEKVPNRQTALLDAGRLKRPDAGAALHILRKTFGDTSVKLASEVEVPRRIRVLREWQSATGWR
jgi:DNA polymerase-4